MIPHATNLPENLSEYRITEKLDGANLQIGLDDHGKLFVSRSLKGGRIYAAWPEESWCNGFRSAHKVICNNSTSFQRHMSPGDLIDCEILFGPQPNVMRYSDHVNYIVFLRILTGHPDLEKLFNALKGQHFSNSVNYDTADGFHLFKKVQRQIWQFENVPEIDPLGVDDHVLSRPSKFGPEMEGLIFQGPSFFKLVRSDFTRINHEYWRTRKFVKDEIIKPFHKEFAQAIGHPSLWHVPNRKRYLVKHSIRHDFSTAEVNLILQNTLNKIENCLNDYVPHSNIFVHRRDLQFFADTAEWMRDMMVADDKHILVKRFLKDEI